MATAREIIARKAHQRPALLTVDATSTVRDAARLMTEHGIGGVPVLVDGRIAGIFTERDVLRRVVAEGRDPATTIVDDVMTKPVVVATSATPLDECASVMTTRRLRHLPVVDGDEIVGMITIGDVLALRAAEQEVTIAELNRYVFDLR